jgi:spermidine/putrescine transport system permease protein
MTAATVAHPVSRRRDLSRPILGAVTATLFLYLYAPIVVIAILALNRSEIASFPMTGITLRWIREALTDPVVQQGIENSLLVAFAVVVMTLPLSLILAHALHRHLSQRGANLLVGLVTMPMQTPRIVLAVLLLLLFSFIGIRPNLGTVVLSHVVLTIPFATLVISARFKSLDRALEEAASDLGASRLQSWVYVLLPLLAPALIAAAMITFTISFDEMVVTYFTIGTQSTLPIVIWGMLSQGYTPELNALGAVITVFTFVLIVAAQLLRGDNSLT